MLPYDHSPSVGADSISARKSKTKGDYTYEIRLPLWL